MSVSEEKKPSESGASTEEEVKASTAANLAGNLEASEEAKLRSRYPSNRPLAGHSGFLQRRLAKGQQKYFDSGDYQMAQQKPHSKSHLPPLLSQPTGDAIPTPESVPVRKTSIIQQSKLTSTAS